MESIFNGGDPLAAAMEPPRKAFELKAQEGPQARYVDSTADIIVSAGGAGSGKSFGSLIRAITECIEIPGHKVLIFRLELQSFLDPGGMWDEMCELYDKLGGKENGFGRILRHPRFKWEFPNGSTIQLAHLKDESTHERYKSSQIGLAIFEECTEIRWEHIVYVGISRARSTTGLKPTVCMTCNPDEESEIKKLIAPWVDKKHPLYKVPDSRILYLDGTDPEIEVVEEEFREDGSRRLSIEFIPSLLSDNRILLEKDPGYSDRFNAMSEYEKQRLRDANWDATKPKGPVFDRDWFDVVASDMNRHVIMRTRCWDTAGSTKSATSKHDYTVGLLASIDTNGYMVIEDVVRFKCKIGELAERIKEVALSDTVEVCIGLEIESGSQASGYIMDMQEDELKNFTVYSKKMLTSKLARASNCAFDAQRGKLGVLNRHWTTEFLKEVSTFDGGKKGHDDQVDAMSLAHHVLRDVAVNPNAFKNSATSVPMHAARASLYGAGFEVKLDPTWYEEMDDRILSDEEIARGMRLPTPEEEMAELRTTMMEMKLNRPSLFGPGREQDEQYFQSMLDFVGYA